MSRSLDGKSADRVHVVGARIALDEYLKYSAYICQPNRPFARPSDRMAFYINGQIDRRIPKIIGEIDCISPNEMETKTDLSDSDRARLRTLLKKMDSARSERWRKEPQKIIFLTSPDSQETLVLPDEIKNDIFSKRGKKPFARPHSYVSLSSLEKAKYISDLEDI